MAAKPLKLSTAAAVPPAKRRMRNSSSATTGLGDRRSTNTKSGSSAPDSVSSATTAALLQPQSSPRLTASTRLNRSPNSTTAPGMSSPRGRPSGAASRRSASASSDPPRLSGRRVQKIARQSSTSTSTPPSTGPVASPAPTSAPWMPSAHPRERPGNDAVTIAVPLDITIAAPSACTTRAPTSSGRVPLIAASPVPTVKTRKPPA